MFTFSSPCFASRGFGLLDTGIALCVGSVGNFREGRGVYRDSQFDFSIPFARLSRGSTFFHFSSIDSSVLVFFFLEGILRNV